MGVEWDGWAAEWMELSAAKRSGVACLLKRSRMEWMWLDFHLGTGNIQPIAKYK